MPVVVLPEAEQKEIALPLEQGSIALFYEDENGALALAENPISPLAFFLTAADVSLPEWLLEDLVFCNEMRQMQPSIYGVFSLFAYRGLRKGVDSQWRKRADGRARAGLSTVLFSCKGEKGALRRLRLARIFRTWENG